MSQPSVAPHNAPLHDADQLPVRPPDLMLGRDSDIAAVHLALKANRPILLYGAPGSGKSALSAAVAAERAGAEGGVLWLDLAEDSLRSLLARVARAYGAVLLPDGDPAQHIVIVRDLLRARSPLIVLDGVVNLPAARAFVQACCADLPVLLTHTQRGVGPWESHAVEPLTHDDSEALLILLSGPEVDADVGEINRVADATGGYPLAITIAGHALATSGVTPEDFRAQLPVLPRGAVNRMLAVILAAYRLLPPALQAATLLLGTTFGAGASEALLAEVAEAPAETLRLALRQLVKRGFAASYPVYGEMTYRAHELVRHFVTAFLRGNNQLDALRARQLAGLMRYVRQQTATNDPDRHNRLAAEIGAVLAAARYAARHGRTEQLEELVLRLDPSGDDDFAAARGFQTELKWLWHLLDEPQAANMPLLAWAHEPVEEEVTGPDERPPLPQEDSPAAEAAPPVEPAADSEGEAEAGPDMEPEPEIEPMAEEQDTLPAGLDYATGIEPLDEAGAAFEDLASVLEHIAEAPIEEFAEDQAEELAEEPETLEEPPEAAAGIEAEPGIEAQAVASFEVEDEPEVEAETWAEMPSSLAEDAAPPPSMPEESPAPVSRAEAARLRHLAQGADGEPDIESRIAYYAQALDAYHANGNVSDELAALEALAALSLERSDYENVLNYVDRGMALADQLNDPLREGKLLMLLGELQAQLGRTEGAEIAFQEAIRALRPSDAWLEIGQVLNKLATLYLDTGRPEDAIAVLEQAVPIFERVQRADWLAKALEMLGEAHASLLDWPSARRAYYRAVELVRAAGDQRQTFDVLSRLGGVLEESGDYAAAQSVYRHALHFAFELDDQLSIGETLVALARMLMNDTVQLNRVVQLLEEATERLPDSSEARRLLSRARTRQERLTSAGVTLMLPENSVRDYASVSMDEDS